MGDRRLKVVAGDITKLPVDAIVNAANSSLLGGGGVDGAIHRAAGPELLAFCRTLGGCPTGEGRITPGFRLTARYVIHVVGPVWHGGGRGEAEALASCYRSAFRLAAEKGLASIAFPAVSCGVYGYPRDAGARVAVAESLRALSSDPRLEEVLLVAFGDDMERAFREALAEAG
jgi:O-acetyl-ADP-ribose deacetylase (regulator of RNase III)